MEYGVLCSDVIGIMTLGREDDVIIILIRFLNQEIGKFLLEMNLC